MTYKKSDMPSIVWNEMTRKILNESNYDFPIMEKVKIWQEKTGLGYVCTGSKEKGMVSVIVLDEQKFFLSKIMYGF